MSLLLEAAKFFLYLSISIPFWWIFFRPKPIALVIEAVCVFVAVVRWSMYLIRRKNV